MRGASGARVDLTEKSAVKSALEVDTCERLRAQYDWLAQHVTLPVVRVLWFDTTCYVMERLEEWDTEPYYAARLLAPAEKVWAKPAEVELDSERHAEWVRGKLGQIPFELWSPVCEVMQKVRYVATRTRHLRRCLTHGDLTRANTMARGFGGRCDSVLIDPIPATSACADIWVFDLSVVIISLLGLEHVVYGWPPPSDEDRLWISQLLMRCNPVELECVRYMCVVQIARRLPYFKQEVWGGLIRIAGEALFLRP